MKHLSFLEDISYKDLNLYFVQECEAYVLSCLTMLTTAHCIIKQVYLVKTIALLCDLF